MINKEVDISKKQDRGVLKKITKTGEGDDIPSAGCEVRVHYTGTLQDGSKFDSSKDRNEPFKFTLGVDQVIKAWEIGVATMKKGEVCILTCAPEYAYGANGSPPKIPPNATLNFEIEMIDWELEDVSPNKTKAILRNIVEPGEGSTTPNDGALISIDLEARLHSNQQVFDKRKEVTFHLGEGSQYNICEGVEKALEKFKAGETSKLIIQPQYGFKDGHKDLEVPPNAVLEYVVKLNSFERLKDVWLLEEKEMIEQGKNFKTKGTEYFKNNKLNLAITMYKRTVNYLTEVKDGEKSVASELLIPTYLNLSLCYLKLTPPEYFEAREHATKALELDPSNVKGLFRRGQALVGMEDVSTAIQDFEKVLEREPDNKAAANQIAICRAKLHQQKQKEKQLYANMFDKFAKHDTEAEKIRARAEVDVIGEKVGEWGIGEGEWTDQQRDRKPTEFEKENPNILMLDKDGRFQNM